MIRWLGLCAFIAKGPDFIPGWGSKILQEVPCGNKQTKTKEIQNYMCKFIGNDITTTTTITTTASKTPSPNVY